LIFLLPIQELKTLYFSRRVRVMSNNITFLGKVTNVNTTNIEVEISNEIPSASPIIKGVQYRIGQIGTLVRIPIGNTNLYGIVDSVNISGKNLNDNLNVSRRINVNLIGEKVGRNAFKQGVGFFPTINDDVHLVTSEDLKDIYGEKTIGQIKIGKHSSSDDLPIFIDLHKFVLRHSAILGSTGSGKSNTTAQIINSILSGYIGSRIVLVDIHGEYASAFPEQAKIFKINDATNPLYIPFWAMDFDELAFFLVGREIGSERPEDKRLREEVLELKKKNLSLLLSGSVDEKYITSDSPVPFDIRKMWHNFNREVYGTFSEAAQDKQNLATEMLDDEGDPENLIAATFEAYSMDSTAPYKSKKQTMYAYENKIYSRLSDNKFDFMFNPGDYKLDGSKDLHDLLKEWIDHEKRLTILDLSGVPFEMIDISVGLINRIIYDSMFWGKYEDYTGKSRPILMIFEEAHTYLPKNQDSRYIHGYARRSVEKLFKEGRKFGVGAMVVTQRPSEISDTILAQVGTFIALRLTNSSDQGTIKAASPNNMNSLMNLLPTLRIGEGIIVGDSIKIASRVRFELHEPRPSSNDPDIETQWQLEFEKSEDHYKTVVKRMRERKY
jgi:hypothetical protein